MWIDDRILEQCHEPLSLEIWVPEEVCVVLGSSNRIDVEVDEEQCSAAGVPILKRYGGGGTVVLYPGSVVISLGAWVRRDFHNAMYFERLNESVIRCLQHFVPEHPLSQNGISDIVCGQRKVAGTSLFRSRNYLLYQASLLVKLDTDLISRCLRHPSKEPDYRGGRSHAEFLVGLADMRSDLSVADVCGELRDSFAGKLAEVLADELVAPIPAQFRNLLRRAERGRQADSIGRGVTTSK